MLLWISLTRYLQLTEPTVVPSVLIDLCSVTIFHRFSSPSWWEHIIKHISADVSATGFDLVVKLKVWIHFVFESGRLSAYTVLRSIQTGEAVVLAPSGLYVSNSGSKDIKDVMQYGRLFLCVRIRQRVTKDVGASILVV